MNRILNLDAQKHTFFYKLLMSPKAGYRISRHFILFLAAIVISFNQIYMGFLEYDSLLGNNLYFLSLLILLSYLFEVYLNIYVLIPRLFLKGKYITYFALFLVIVLFFIFTHYVLEYSVLTVYNIEPGIYSYFKEKGSPFWLGVSANFFMDYIAILGVGLTVILRSWLVNMRQVHQLENIYMQTEVEKLKEQINPLFLFSILHAIGDIAIDNQRKASNMLMEFSEILRYQLYDCNREKVLLNAEIEFISAYLQVEKLNCDEMDFEIQSEGDINRIFVPPLLFIPLVQSAVKGFREAGEHFSIHLHFQSGSDFISFCCECRNIDLLLSPDLEKIKQRLEKLYEDRYILQVKQHKDGDYPTLYLHIKF